MYPRRGRMERINIPGKGTPGYSGLRRSSAMCDWIALLFVVDSSSSQKFSWWNISLFTFSKSKREEENVNETDFNKVFWENRIAVVLCVLFLPLPLPTRSLHHTGCHLQMCWVKKFFPFSESDFLNSWSTFKYVFCGLYFLLVISTWTLICLPGNGKNFSEAID